MQSDTHHNVLAFGADRDGERDSTGAIQNALHAAMNDPCRRSVYLPDGNYRIDGGMFIDTGAFDDTWNIRVFSDGGATLLARAGVTVFTVVGCKSEKWDKPAPRRVHFQRLHLIQTENTLPIGNTDVEVGFYLAAPECRLDDVDVSGFRGAGVRLRQAEMTSLHRCRIWHNRVNVEDLGDSPATELTGCRLIYARNIGRDGGTQGTGLVWNSRGLTVLGGAIEQNVNQEVSVGRKFDSMARFYGVHFEHENYNPASQPMVVCGKKGEAGHVQVAFDRCIFMGNRTSRLAICFLGVDSCEVAGCRFENFLRGPEVPIEVADYANNTDKGHHYVVLPAS